VLLEIHKRFLTAGVPGFRSLYATQGTWLDSVKRRFDRSFPSPVSPPLYSGYLGHVWKVNYLHCLIVFICLDSVTSRNFVA
jgi:hypothetical protein